jgi:predicted amidophosphoribosyltransferase
VYVSVAHFCTPILHYTIKDREVILLDDVCTSGSSLKACEKLLINAGASKVYKVVLGLTYREGR